jgi:S1-C subfamily serine protease
VRLRVRRAGAPVVVTVKPEPRSSMLTRWGVSVDGALIAEMPYEDGAIFVNVPGLMVHSVEDGSMASSLNVEKQDLIESVDGRPFKDLPALSKYLAGRKGGSPVRFVLRRWSPYNRSILDYHVRDLPGDEIELIGNPAQSVAAK